MIDTHLCDLALKNGRAVRAYIRYVIETHPFPIPALFDSGVWFRVTGAGSTGFLKKRLQLSVELEDGATEIHDLLMSAEDFAMKSPLCVDFLSLASAYASLHAGPIEAEVAFLPLDHRYNLNEIEEYLVKRIWDRYMELQMAIDMRRELRSLSVATPKNSALDIQRHLEATPRTEGRGNQGFMIEEMRNGIKRTVVRSR